MKKIIAFLIAAITLFSTVGVFAEQIVTVTLDGKEIEFDVPAQVINDRTMVPMRKTFESLGASVDWVEAEQGIVAVKGSKLIAMKINSHTMLVTDVATGEQKRIELDVPPMIVGDRTLVPVRAISESLGIKVDWIEETQTVVLTMI